MNSVGNSLAWPILSHVADEVAAPSGGTDPPRILFAVDQAIAYVATALLVVVLLRWLARPPRNPLVAAPDRANSLREESILLAVMVYLMATLFLSAALEVAGILAEGALHRLVSGSGAQIAGIGICLYIAENHFDGGVRRFLRGPRDADVPFLLTISLLTTLMAVGLCPLILTATEKLVLHLAPDFEFSAHPTIDALHDGRPTLGMVTALWIGAAVIAPAGEEVFFRGIVQTFAVNVLRSRWVAIGLTSVAFGVVHFGQPQVIPALIVLAVLIGYTYERTGSLIPPILIHAAFNLKTLVWDAMFVPAA